MTHCANQNTKPGTSVKKYNGHMCKQNDIIGHPKCKSKRKCALYKSKHVCNGALRESGKMQCVKSKEGDFTFKLSFRSWVWDFNFKTYILISDQGSEYWVRV